MCSFKIMHIRNLNVMCLNECKMSVSQKLGCNSKDAMERKKKLLALVTDVKLH